MSERKALDRTLRLIRLDLFPEAPEPTVLTALTSTRVRLRATANNLKTNAGQTALVTTLLLINRLGASISLDVPAESPTQIQPPLSAAGLRPALERISPVLLRPLSTKRATDVEIVFGDTAPTGDAWFLRVEANDWHGGVTRNRSGTPLIGTQPFGAAYAAVAVAAEVFRRSMRIVADSGTPALPEHNLADVRDVTIELPPVLTGVDLGTVDVVSAGALSSAALYLLLRVPHLRAKLRIVDDDLASVDNLNRYLLLTRDVLSVPKVDVLARYQRDAIEVVPVRRRITDETIREVLPLSERVLVGVDDIPARWMVQKHASGWVGVAATSHFETVVSEHVPGSACAGCLHPYDDDGRPGPLPTISFVSAFAGFDLAYRLVRAGGSDPRPDVTISYPFNLSAPRAIQTLPCPPHPKCPLRCTASTKLVRAA